VAELKRFHFGRVAFGARVRHSSNPKLSQAVKRIVIKFYEQNELTGLESFFGHFGKSRTVQGHPQAIVILTTERL